MHEPGSWFTNRQFEGETRSLYIISRTIISERCIMFKIGERAFPRGCPSAWNALPENLRAVTESSEVLKTAEDALFYRTFYRAITSDF